MEERAARPRGLGPLDLLSAEELARYLRCNDAAAVEWAARVGVPRLTGPGRAGLYLVADVVDALRRGLQPRIVPAATPPRGTPLRRAGLRNG